MATVLKGKYSLVTLKSGISIVNFGSPHSYTFDTGEVLNECSEEVSREMQLVKDHTGIANVIIDTADSRLRVPIPKDRIDSWRDYVGQNHPGHVDCKMWLDVFINYQIANVIQDDILTLAEMDIIDVILVPYPVMDAWEYETKLQREIATGLGNDALVKFTDNWQYALLKMRTCHLQDRVTKIVYSDRFCSSTEAVEGKSERKTLTLTRNEV